MATEEKAVEQKAAETKPKAKAKKKKTQEQLLSEFKIAKEYGELWLIENQSKEGKFKLTKELEEAKKAAEKLDGPKAKKSGTIVCKRVKTVFVEGMPVSEYFANLFSDAQKKQYLQ